MCADCPPGVSGRLVFYSTVVDDAVTGTSALNLQASTESVFDEELRFRGLTPAFSLNRFNHLASLDILGPRAVAYSTGMLNYFFRGDISMEPDPASPGDWVIVNNGPDAMSGTFALYYDYDVPPDSTGNRKKHVEWQLSVAAGGRVSVGPVAFPTIPAPSKVGEFMLVFSGTMGSEGLGNSAVGAVAGRKVDLAPVLIFAAFRDDDPDDDGIMEFDLFVPATMADAINRDPSALTVGIGGVEVPSSSFGFYTPCTTYLSGQCLANLGLGTYPLQWQSTLTKSNQFVVRSQTGDSAGSGERQPAGGPRLDIEHHSLRKHDRFDLSRCRRIRAGRHRPGEGEPGGANALRVHRLAAGRRLLRGPFGNEERRIDEEPLQGRNPVAPRFQSAWRSHPRRAGRYPRPA